MKMTLEGSNSAETSSLWDGGTRLHLPVTGKLAVRSHNYFFISFYFFFKELSIFFGFFFFLFSAQLVSLLLELT